MVSKQRARWRSRVASGECSGNTLVPAIDEWAAASACTEPGRLAGVEPGAAALASADPCRGSNGRRDVGHGSLTCVFISCGAGPGAAGRPTACKRTDGKSQIHRAPLAPTRAPRSRIQILDCQQEKTVGHGRAHSYFAIPAENEFASPRAGTRPAPVYFLLCAALDAAGGPSGQAQRLGALKK